MVALVDPQRKSAPDVQESSEPSVTFFAQLMSKGKERIYVLIRKKADNIFVISTSIQGKVHEYRITAEALRKALVTRILEITQEIRIKLDKLKPIIRIYNWV